MKLFVLLALNTGMTQIDINHLYRHQVDYKNGYIVRKRGKTKWHPNVPTVRYRLWPETLKLLQRYDSGRMGKDDPVLLNYNGNEFVQYTFKANGKTNRLDIIGGLFNALISQHFPELKGKKTFRSLRKTGATILGNDPRYFFVSWMYLGHSAKSIAERHYIKPSQELIDEAIDWLESNSDLHNKVRPTLAVEVRSSVQVGHGTAGASQMAACSILNRSADSRFFLGLASICSTQA